ncbi:hypothetical protein [Zobellia alginiliquefaciens]|uniref:hypothetical protein n=1 Tax=Zobellia alginiliquefaciens TaxID=3032586 RepID=UPI0023E3B1D0|nr:hypothetical protein [Zobellia alginiliquefaciens]
MKQYIEFKKQREMSQILSDTFGFLRNEFKSFFGVFFKIIAPYLVVMLISYGFYMFQVGDLMSLSLGGSESIINGMAIFMIALIFIIATVTTYVLAQATTLFYIKSYIKNNGAIDFSEIKQNVYGSFWKFIGLGFLFVICVGAGLIFCIIPGVYLYVPLVLSFSILAFDEKSITDAFSDSFTLVKEYWWITFASLFVVFIIVMVAGSAFALPGTIYSFAKTSILPGEMDAENFNFADPVSIILGIISKLAQFLLHLISIVASVLIYFDLNEKKNFTGTFERIKNLGGDTEE